MIDKSRIGFFTPSIGLENAGQCLEFVRARGGLIQAWTLPPTVAHEIKPGLDINTIVAEVENSRIRVSSLSGYMDWTKADGNDLRRREFVRIIKQCKQCGCDIICTETGRDYTSRDDGRAWGLLVDSMRDLCREAAKSDVYIAVEMGRLDLIFGAHAFRKLQQLVQSDRLKINFDPANLMRGEIDPVQAARELKDDVAQVHLKDASPDGMRPLTHGAVDFTALFDIFEGNSYRGNYIIEAEYPSQNKPESVAGDYENILKLSKVSDI